MAEHNTITFSLKNQKDDEMKRTLTEVYNALVEKGYVGSVDEAFGSLLSETGRQINSTFESTGKEVSHTSQKIETKLQETGTTFVNSLKQNLNFSNR